MNRTEIMKWFSDARSDGCTIGSGDLFSAGLLPCRPGQGGNLAALGCTVLAALGVASVGTVRADTALAEVGIPELQQLVPGLNGGGVAVADVEFGGENIIGTYQQYFEPDPSKLGQPTSKFTFIDHAGVVSQGIYSAGSYFSHSQTVGNIFYGAGAYGVAPGVSNVYVYAEDYYYTTLTAQAQPIGGAAPPAVVNQSFIFGNASAASAGAYDTTWDNYAVRYNTLFVSAIGDGNMTNTPGQTGGGFVNPPSSSYNGIAVGVYSGSVSGGIYGPSSGGSAAWVGPTWDGRSKPDLVAPVPNAGVIGNYTSYSAPVVSGVATLMEQAARGTNLPGPVGLSASDASVVSGGATAYTTAATDIRTVKALLLNGAVKPVGWTNNYSITSNGAYLLPTYTYNAVNANAVTPLDPRYGSGVVNAYNSYENLAGGEHNFTSTTMQSIAALPSVTSAPTANFTGTFSQAASAANPATITGWNLASISASSTGNAVENYDFNLTGTSLNSWDLTATLTWNKNYNASGINHLMLFLLNSSGQRVASSTSMLDNVQQININPALGINSLAPGQYDLAVEMLGGVNTISTSDTYALAWNFVDPTTVPEPTALAIFALGLSLLAMPKKRPAGIGGR